MNDMAQLSDLDVLVTGASGMLGRSYARALADAYSPRSVTLLSRHGLDVTDAKACDALASRPTSLIVHCAGWVDADGCERDPERCERIIVAGTENIARLALATGAQVLYPQSFLIFDSTNELVTEATVPTPVSAYGRAKLAAEHVLIERLPSPLIVRMGGFFGGCAVDKNFVGKYVRGLVARAARGERRIEVGARVWQPTYTDDLAHNSLALIAAGRSGVFHMASHGQASFFELAKEIHSALGIEARFELIPAPAEELAKLDAAVRPSHLVMDNVRLRSEGFDHMRPWQSALRSYLELPYFRELARDILRSTP